MKLIGNMRPDAWLPSDQIRVPAERKHAYFEQHVVPELSQVQHVTAAKKNKINKNPIRKRLNQRWLHSVAESVEVRKHGNESKERQ